MTFIHDVTFSYQCDPDAQASQAAVPGVVDLTLECAPGSCTLVTGPSGSGKSTVIKLLNGLIPELFKGQLTGQVSLGGLDTQTTDIQTLGRTAGTVFQNPRTQFFTSTVLQELAFAGENAGEDPDLIKDTLARAATTWGIGDLLARNLDSLSGGQAQLVASAAAMCGPQRILLFDEPTSNLSPEGIRHFRATITELKRAGWTLVVAEHRLYPFQGLADQVLILRAGRVEQQLSGDKFFAGSYPDLRSVSEPPRTQLPAPAPAPASAPGVRASNLTFSYGHRQVLDVPQIHIPAGKVTALTGPNGAGKTTLARVLVGLARPEKGTEIYFGNQRLGTAQRTRNSVLVMQDVNRQIFAETVSLEVTLGIGTTTSSSNGHLAAAGQRVLADLGLAGLEERHPMTLSGGQKQRLVIANAVMSNAQFYVFDEPTSGVDFQHLTGIAKLIRKLADSGKSVLVITHDREFINAVADYEFKLSPLALER